jgi:hypothetical protein
MFKGIEKYFWPFLDHFSAILAQNKHIFKSRAILRPSFSLARSFSFLFLYLYLNIVLNTHITYIMNLKKIILFVWKHICIPSEGVWRQSHWFRKKWFFSLFGKKKYFFGFFWVEQCLLLIELYVDKPYKKIWALS